VILPEDSSMATHMTDKAWPRWISRAYEVQLREVAPGLYVGGRQAFNRAREEGLVFGEVVTFTGRRLSPAELAEQPLQLIFHDGRAFPEGFLGIVQACTEGSLAAGQSVLLHCQAGLSRSASAAYALLRVAGLSPDDAAFRVHAGYARFPVPETLASAEAWALKQGAAP
jgi:hypothetical protein